MKRVGVIGGTFNPIHLAHLYIAYEAKEQLKLDKVIFMPAGSPPHKDIKNVLMPSLRYKMVELAIESYEDFEISNYEIEKLGYSYTYETLEYLKAEACELFFVTGADCLMNIESWKNPGKIFSLSNFIVFNRAGYNKEMLMQQIENIEKKYNTRISFLDIMDLEISSSMIRNRINNSKRVDFFLPKNVLEFIEENNLYKG